MSLESLIGSLSREEKLAAMELIWADLSADSWSYVNPAWHERVIADRLNSPAPEPTLPLAEARTEIRKAIDARRASG